MGTAKLSIYDDITVEKLDCVGPVQKRMGKHLLNLTARTKGKLADGQPIGGLERLRREELNSCKTIMGLQFARTPLKGKPNRKGSRCYSLCHEKKKHYCNSSSCC